MLDEKLTRAKVALMMDKPYFGMMSSHLQVELSENQESFLSDGERLYINDEYLADLNVEETQFILSNAAMHRLLDHRSRQSGKMGWLWQLATDYAINAMLVQNGMTLPDRVNYQSRFDGMYAEEIYAELKTEIMNENYDDDEDLESGYNEQNKKRQKEQPQQPDQKDANAQKGPGQESESQEEQSFIEAQHHEALHKADLAGQTPLGIERLIDATAYATLDWRSLLTDFIQTHLHGDFTRFPPNKRFLHQGIYLPAYTPSHQKLAIVIDTSASISEKILAQFVAEIEAIRLDVEMIEIELFMVDAKLHAHESFVYGQPLEITLVGGGGTKFEPAFDYIEEESIPVGALLYFTDGEGSFPDREPDYPVMWVLTKPTKLPFGESVVLEESAI